MKTIINFSKYAFLIILFLSSCAHKSGHNNKENNEGNQSAVSPGNGQNTNDRTEKKIGSHTVVQMTKEDGVYYVPAIVNDLNLKFVFDTGASNISLSVAEATVMARQGKITQDDVVGKAKFSDANGDVSVGTVVLLRTVQIGDITLHNVEASVVDNIKAPLLLGQSALEKFGKLTIDYKNNTIEFN